MALPPGASRDSSGSAPSRPSSGGPDKKKKKKTADPTMASATEAAFRRYIQMLGLLNPKNYGQTQMGRLFPNNQLGPNYTPAQLRAQAQQALAQIFNPRIAQVRNTFERQMKLGGQNINAYTGTYVNRLGEIPQAIANANQQALQQQSAVGGALADYMRNTGSEISQDLTARMASTGLSPEQIAGTVGTAGQTGFLGSGEVAGLSGSSLMRMSQEGNAWQNWGNALPGIGILQGQQELGKFQGQMNEGFLQSMGDINSMMAEAGVNLYQGMLDRDLERRGLGLQRSQAMAGYLSDAEQRRLNAAMASGTLAQSWAEMLLQRELGLAGIQADLRGQDIDKWISQHPIFAPPTVDPDDLPLKTGEYLESVTADYYSSPLAGQIQPGLVPVKQARNRIMNWLLANTTGSPTPIPRKALVRLVNQIMIASGYRRKRRGAGAGQRPQQQPPENTGVGDMDDGPGWIPWVGGPGMTDLLGGLLGGG